MSRDEPRDMTATPREPTLKPCPFCGSSNIDPAGWMDGDGNAGPACDDCGASAESVDAWNRRVAPATAGEDAIWLSPELNYGEQPAPASRDEGADELQRLRERVRTLEAAILDEPEFPGPMPDEMWERVHNDRDACQEALRLAVRLTKQGILARAALQSEEGNTP
jgi:hypothetical protein